MGLFVMGLIYGIVIGGVIGWMFGFRGGYNLSRSETEHVRVIQELCESCLGYGYHINTDRLPKLQKDKCDFCSGTGHNTRYIEIQRMTWSSMWRRRRRRTK